ncbi:MAG: ABC transporter permease, partial [Myxococcales bacterium]|nr:ABC transporter permease [Myxococcales bacterium]
MRALWTLAANDLRLLLRDRVSLFWILAFPLILALFFGTLFGGGSSERAAMEVVVVDDSGGSGAAFVERLRASEGLQIDAVGSLADAEDLVRRGDRVAFVQLRPGFADGGFALFGRGPDAAPLLALGVDPARTAERGLLQGLVTQALFAGMTEQLADPARMLAQTQDARASLAAAADRHTMDTLGAPSPVLMERAALCVSAEVEAIVDARAAAHVLILVGPGNNGGDGLAIARQLHGRGRSVEAVLVTPRHNAAVAAQLQLARSHGV